MRLPDIKMVIRIISYLMLIEAGFLIISSMVSFGYGENDYLDFLFAAGCETFLACAGILFTPKNSTEMGKREGYLVVSLVWIIFSLFGMLPFYMSGASRSITDAFFETMSGFTTTGATIFTDVETLSHGLLFWRGLTQWIGGLGIITLFLAILPVIGFDGMSLFAAEVPGISKTKLHARVGQTAKFFWIVYLGLTIMEVVFLRIAGMEIFDSICHSFSTMACGGFSTKNASIAHWASPAIEYIITLFMALGGINFALYFFLLKGQPGRFFKDEELHYYTMIIIIVTTMITSSLIAHENCSKIEEMFRHAIFSVVSVMTTTGFTNCDYMSWNPFSWTILIIVMAFGGMAGSTAGGIKTARIALLIKNSYYEFKRLAHPNAIIPVRFNGVMVETKTMNNVLAFVFLYITITILGILSLTAFDMGFVEAVSSALTAIGNVGVGMGDVGPAYNFAAIPNTCKWIMSILMLIGRLELFTVLILFTPAFWKQ